MQKSLRILTGLGLVLVGIIGIIMPVMPGWSLLLPGLILLEEHLPPVRRLLDWSSRRAARVTHPRLRRYCQWYVDALAWGRQRAAEKAGA